MKYYKLFFSILILIGTQSFCQEARFSAKQFSNGTGDTLNYRFLFPDFNPARKYPLVIFLHGSGERGDDNISQLQWGVMNFATDYNLKMYKSFVIAPQCPKDQTWDNFKEENFKWKFNDTASTVCELLLSLIDSTVKNYAIDVNRIYITGMSMGGIGTYDLIMRRPTLFAAAVPVCGAGDTSKASTIKDISLWIFHGAEDDIINSQNSLDMVVALTRAGAHPGFTLYPSVGHFSWTAAYSDPMLMEWLFRQKKANTE
ncbi:MAG: prolyl oligopeptidase family serine peptidase [Cytophagaceae bacterium]|jgi:predicted peptidase|nr:prolyl oligopeptidase family serine peptidase [Cytophagaceae bacterium]